MERETVRKYGLYNQGSVINIDNYVKEKIFVTCLRSYSILGLSIVNIIDSKNQRPNRKYNICFERKYLKIFHTSIYRSEMMYPQFQTIYHRIDMLFLEIESRIRIKKTTVKLSARLVFKIIQFSDNKYDVVSKELLENDKKILGQIDTISDWYQKRYRKFIDGVITTLNGDFVNLSELVEENEKSFSKKELSIFKSFSLKTVETFLDVKQPCETDSIFFVVEFEFYESRNHYTPRIVIRVLEKGILFLRKSKNISPRQHLQ